MLVYNPYKTSTDEWVEPFYNYVKFLNETYKFDKTSSKYIVPKGHILYHGSLEKNLELSNRRTFFSPNKEMSLWYILELYDESKKKENTGYLYEFEICEDIEVDLLEKSIHEHAKNYNLLNNITYKLFNFEFWTNINHIHPQIVARGRDHLYKQVLTDCGNEIPSYKLCTEITIYDKKSLIQTNKYNINIDILNSKRDDFEFNVEKSFYECLL